MLDEISRVMNYMGSTTDYAEALDNNVSGKQTQKNLQRTNAAIKKLYALKSDFLPFRCFQHFWQISPDHEKSMLVFLYALAMDIMVYDVAETVIGLQTSEQVTSSQFANVLENLHHDEFSPKTIASASRNLISSYRQAGLITGSGKNIKSDITIGIYAFAFAYLMAYFNDDRGEFILQSKWVRILGLGSTALRDLAVEASLKGLMEYKYAGSVVTISFNNLFTTLGLYGVES
jgi:hypothetical protein